MKKLNILYQLSIISIIKSFLLKIGLNFALKIPFFCKFSVNEVSEMKFLLVLL